MGRLEGKSVVITGAGSGIGRAAALALVDAGWSVAVVGRRQELDWLRARLGATSAELRPVAVCALQGMAGVGKSYLCDRFFEENQAAFPGGYVVVSLSPVALQSGKGLEVKTRTGDGFGGVEQAVTDAKMRRLRRLAGVWLGEQQAGWSAIRLDVIGIRMRRGREPELSHIRAVG